MKKKTSLLPLLFLFLLLLSVSCNNTQGDQLIISSDELKDRIAGGWAGKMIGVSYGAPTEFRAQNRIYDEPIDWKPEDVRGSIWQDDIYVQLTFLMSMDKYGIDAPAKLYQEMLATAGYPLWHANMQARKNYYDSIFAPISGSPEYNIHADDIDFQIEADYIGFMCPGMPATASRLADRIGRIMNYGDGLYGGIFVAALYSEAFHEKSIRTIVEKALESIPSGSDYHKIISDVIKLYDYYPADWRASWNELQDKWGEVDICGAGSPFNIDAKLNGAYIVMGLLYGEGDPMKTLEISTRCGQDSDCNPSNALAVLGVMNGFSGLPREMQDAVKATGDSTFINTSYSFNSAVTGTYNHAVALITKAGGKIKGSNIIIEREYPFSPELEVSFPDLVFDKTVSVFEKDQWKLKGKWETYMVKSGSDGNEREQSVFSATAGDELAFTFTGTGISLEGNWYRDGGKAEVWVDGTLHRTIDTYYDFAGQQRTESIWHITGLDPGEHTVRLIVKGEKRHEAAGTRVYVSSATIFRTEKKKNETHKFSFE